ncbi:MAG: hypothetical protein IJ588_07005 [Prevotella sp.]|nr:hypothetical protein [Prevotella sp.]
MIKDFTAIIIVLLLCFTSCEASYHLLVDGKPNQEIAVDCGKVVITGFSALSDRIEMSLDGDFWVNPDSLAVVHRLERISPENTTLYLNNSPIDDSHPFPAHGKNQLCIRVSLELPLHYGKTGAMQLLPSKFVLCNDKPVISDTICFMYK